MATRATQRKTTTPIAAVLLVIQALAGGAIPLAHAHEPVPGPTHIETRHDANCVVIHDAMLCALCQYASSLAAPPPAPEAGARISVPAQPAQRTATLGMGSRAYVASRPRAPPLHLS